MRRHRVLIIASITSLLLMATFLVLQSRNGPILEMPTKYLWVSLAPAIIGLFAGGYITKIETPILKVSNDVTNLPEAKRTNNEPAEPEPAAGDWRKSRDSEYGRTSGLVLAHEYKPSDRDGQKFDIFIYLVRHAKNTTKPPKTGFDDVEKVEFYFGGSWGHRVFTVDTAQHEMLGVRTHAFGTFLATCRITFKDPNKDPEIVYRYIDFEMAAKRA